MFYVNIDVVPTTEVGVAMLLRAKEAFNSWI